MNTPDSQIPGNKLPSEGEPDDPIVNAADQYVITNKDDAEKVTNKDTPEVNTGETTETLNEQEKAAPQPPAENL